MKISKQDDKIICELDFYQHKKNPYDKNEEKELTHNLIGVIAGDNFTISHLIDLSYKNSQQEGMPLIHFYGSEIEFIELCEELGISYIKHSLCDYCGKVLYGSFTIGDKGNMCFNCEDEEDAWQKCTNCGTLFDNPLADLCGACFANA